MSKLRVDLSHIFQLAKLSDGPQLDVATERVAMRVRPTAIQGLGCSSGQELSVRGRFEMTDSADGLGSSLIIEDWGQTTPLLAWCSG